jgi:alpha-galactosidase
VSDETYRLDGGGQTLLIAVRAGRPALDYWGDALPAGVEADPRLFDRPVPHGMLDSGEALDLFPQAGHGFTGWPALDFAHEGGGVLSQMTCASVSRTDHGLTFHLADPLAQLTGDLEVTLEPATGVVGMRSRLTPKGAGTLDLHWMACAALPLDHDELLTFGGRWAREFDSARLRLPAGLWATESRSGRTSHHSPPFLVAGEPGFGDDHGEVLALHLAWSGNHRLLAERLRDGRLQVQAGELFLPGEVRLAPGETYETPWLYAARSHAGLNGLADRFHPFVRDHILEGRLKSKPRPVHFNTWEAVYFRHDLTTLKALATQAAAVGAERFVLDDGWFKGRDDDTTSLGDWIPDPVKYPEGLRPLADHVQGLGLEFGLWVEPEMVNAQSDLFRAHPDWILGDPDRDQPLGRGQFVLDLTRPEAADGIFAQLDALLCAAPIAYLKWDMNRDLTHPVSGGRPAARAQTLAVYGLLDRLRAAHPGVEIESCASGGGRADYEILKRTDRIWISDTNDPLERQSIQQAAALFFPPEVLGAHVGPRPSHTTARVTSLETRALTALIGHMGIEADIRAFSEPDRAALTAWIAFHKEVRSLIHAGRRVRLSPPDPGGVAFAVIGAAGALVSLAQIETPKTATLRPLRVSGLEDEMIYHIRLINPPARPRASMKVAPALALGETLTATGALLRQSGLPLPILRAGELAVFHLELASEP